MSMQDSERFDGFSLFFVAHNWGENLSLVERDGTKNIQFEGKMKNAKENSLNY